MTLALSFVIFIGMSSIGDTDSVDKSRKKNNEINRVIWEHGGDLESQF